MTVSHTALPGPAPSSAGTPVRLGAHQQVPVEDEGGNPPDPVTPGLAQFEIHVIDIPIPVAGRVELVSVHAAGFQGRPGGGCQRLASHRETRVVRLFLHVTRKLIVLTRHQR